MDAAAGYIRLYRKLLDNPIWTQLAPAVLKVAVYCLLRANYRPVQWYDGVCTVPIPAGSFITSYGKTATACNLSVQQIRDAFAHLERTQFATCRRTHRWTLVTVLNYEVYQATPTDENTPENTTRNGYGNRQGTTNKESIHKEVNTCASADARRADFPSIEEPPFEPSDPNTLFPLEPLHLVKPIRGEMTPEQDRWFRVWWGEYWRHKGKKEARAAFAKYVRTEGSYQEVLTATRSQKPEMLAGPGGMRPYPATWLNGERWQDETEGAPTESTPATPRTVAQLKAERELRRQEEGFTDAQSD